MLLKYKFGHIIILGLINVQFILKTKRGVNVFFIFVISVSSFANDGYNSRIWPLYCW